MPEVKKDLLLGYFLKLVRIILFLSDLLIVIEISSVMEFQDEEGLNIEHLPSIPAVKILSHLEWNDKIGFVSVFPCWTNHLLSLDAWPSVEYSEDLGSATSHFRGNRQLLSECIQKYGHCMRSIHLGFVYSLGASGSQILSDIANSCWNLERLSLVQQSRDYELVLYNLTMNKWTECALISLSDVLSSCTRLQQVRLDVGNVPWASHYVNTNVLSMLENTKNSNKITELHLSDAALSEFEDDTLQMLRSFTNLKRLEIRRDKITEELLTTLVRNGLQSLLLYFNEECLIDFQDPILFSSEFWCSLVDINPVLSVDVVLQQTMVVKSMFPVYMPLKSLALVDLTDMVTKGIIDTISQNYQPTLESFVFGHTINGYFGEQGATLEDSRLPYAVTEMVENCKKLRSLVYGYSISSTSVLLMAYARRLATFVINYNELSFEFDWPAKSEWNNEFINWLTSSGKSDETLEKAVSEKLGYQWSSGNGERFNDHLVEYIIYSSTQTGPLT
ncbi:unnamed protein product [Owenia fusiformis]|uniref:Uncharacterized protein n=1 Tax=Owenia fusiformis TaxID=6347 RepID=A0A8S4PQC1_OWEFU|nr:unnamed protein product [Owenia fusiformis]